MPLIAEALRRKDLDRLNLEALALSQHRVGAPWAFSVISHRTIMLDFPALKDPNPPGQRDGMPVAEMHAGRRDHLDRPEPGQSLRGMAVG